MKRTIKEVLTGPQASIGGDQTIDTALVLMHELDTRCLPVRLEGKVIGVVGWSDLDRHDVSHTLPVQLIMRRDPLIVAPEAPVHDVVRQMAERNAEAAVVVADDRVLGLFTAAQALRMLEESLAPPREPVA